MRKSISSNMHSHEKLPHSDSFDSGSQKKQHNSSDKNKPPSLYIDRQQFADLVDSGNHKIKAPTALRSTYTQGSGDHKSSSLHYKGPRTLKDPRDKSSQK